MMWKIAKKAAARVTNTEIKHYDLADIAFQNITDSGTATTNVRLLNTIPTTGMEGTSQNREGQQVKCISCHVKATIKGNAADTTPTKVKVILGVKHRDVGFDPMVYADVFDLTESDGTATATTNRVNAHRLTDRTSNITVLKSWTGILEPNGDFAKQLNWYCKLGRKGSGIITQWTETDTTGAYSNITKGALFLMWIGDKATDNYPEIIWNSRVRYIDN